MPLLHQQFTSKDHLMYSVTSGDDYVYDSKDFWSLYSIFIDPPVFEYITRDTLKKYYKTEGAEILAGNFLQFLSIKWQKNKEHRFLIRNENRELVGIIGYDIRSGNIPELWYYKISSAPSFMSSVLPFILDFQKELGFKETFALTEVNNLASQKILLKNGFENKGEVVEDGKKLIKFSRMI